MFPYRLHLLQNLSEKDKILRHSFCMGMQQRSDLFEWLNFGDESTFCIVDTVNKYNVRIWGSETPRAVVQQARDSPKTSVFFPPAVSHKKVYGPFFLQKKTIPGITYLDMLREWLMPQLIEDNHNFIPVQDSAPPHWQRKVRNYLDENCLGAGLDVQLPRTWLVHVGHQEVGI
jgi:hypothetical protein